MAHSTSNVCRFSLALNPENFPEPFTLAIEASEWGQMEQSTVFEALTLSSQLIAAISNPAIERADLTEESGAEERVFFSVRLINQNWAEQLRGSTTFFVEPSVEVFQMGNAAQVAEKVEQFIQSNEAAKQFVASYSKEESEVGPRLGMGTVLKVVVVNTGGKRLDSGVRNEMAKWLEKVSSHALGRQTMAFWQQMGELL